MEVAHTPEDWLNAGFQILRECGEGELTLARLGQLLGLSKGSFYHHFADMDRYRSQLLEGWERGWTEIPLQQAGGRSRELLRSVLGLDMDLDLAVRAWGLRDAQVGEAVRRVDRIRMGGLERLYRDRGMERPELRAQLDYALFLGLQQLGRTDQLETLLKEVKL